jgi:hypothetical protein
MLGGFLPILPIVRAGAGSLRQAVSGMHAGRHPHERARGRDPGRRAAQCASSSRSAAAASRSVSAAAAAAAAAAAISITIEVGPVAGGYGGDDLPAHAAGASDPSGAAAGRRSTTTAKSRPAASQPAAHARTAGD